MVDMRQVRIGCEFVQMSPAPTPSVLQIRPIGESPVQVTSETWSVDPATHIRGYTDMYGNHCLRTVLPAGRSVFSYTGEVLVPDATEDVDVDAEQIPPDRLPDHALVYTLPSRYVLPEMLRVEDCAQFAELPGGYAKVQAVCDFVHDHLFFAYGTTGPATTSHDVFLSRYGVCRDFTHLAIAFCRALDIPARYVFGYLPRIDVGPADEPMDFAAWMEVWLADRWWTFDPRNNERRKGRVLIGRGRDASDVAMVTAFGAPVLELMTVVAEEIVVAEG